MLRRLLPIILLLHYFQGLGYCSGPSALQDVDPTNPSDAASKADHLSSTDGPEKLNNNDRAQQKGDEKPASMDNRRQRRHIGSIAAFRGLPGPFNKFNPAEWPLSSAGWDWKKVMTPGADFVDYGEGLDEDVIKDKRYPDVIQAAIQRNGVRPNPVLMRNNPIISGKSSNKNFEILPPPHNEARARAVSRLLRLLSEARANSAAGANSISKKFLGALARNNALPASGPKAILPFVQYKGSTAIPLPGKRTLINSGAPRILDNRSEATDTDAHLEFSNQVEEFPMEDVYSDDVMLGMGEDEDQTDDYSELVTSKKRNIASLAAKGGWARPSRTCCFRSASNLRSFQICYTC